MSTVGKFVLAFFMMVGLGCLFCAGMLLSPESTAPAYMGIIYIALALWYGGIGTAIIVSYIKDEARIAELRLQATMKNHRSYGRIEVFQEVVVEKMIPVILTQLGGSKGDWDCPEAEASGYISGTVRGEENLNKFLDILVAAGWDRDEIPVGQITGTNIFSILF